MIPIEIKDKILHEAELTRVIGEFITLKKKGSKMVGDCPQCKKKDSLTITSAKQIWKCFSCDYGGNSPVQFVMDYKKVSFPAALKIVAGFYGIEVDEAPRPRGPQRKDHPKAETFRDRMLKDSGITDENQKATVWDPETDKWTITDVFEAGTKDQYGKLATGDDMIIWYYDLRVNRSCIRSQKPQSRNHCSGFAGKFRSCIRIRLAGR